MHGTELEQFRARWQREVATRHRSVPHAAPREETHEERERPAGLDRLSVKHEALDPKVQAEHAVEKDRLTKLLAALVPAHEARVREGAEEAVRSGIERMRLAGDRSTDGATAGQDTSGTHAPHNDTHARSASDANGAHATDATDAPGAPAAATLAPRPMATVYELHAADEDAPIPAASLPDEVWIKILTHAVHPCAPPAPAPVLAENMSYQPPKTPWRTRTGPDYITLEYAARVCWKLRLLTAHPKLWRLVVQATYLPPQIPPTLSVDEVHAAHSYSWRDTFIEQPRIRMNGAYIASCQYTQQGMSEENVWVRVLHLVEFFRYLRFFPNGQCLSMLTVERPGDTVHQLVPGVRAKGLAVGRWHLLPDAANTLVVIDDLSDASLPNYRFQMTLVLRETQPGRWNKLEMLEYASLHLHTGEVLPFPHKHQRPFYFSRVKGYGV